MSFRGRLRLFFAVIVIVPMVALGIVLFALTARSETGKADAGLASATRTAVGVYREQLDSAQQALDRVARDPRLQRDVARERIPAAAGRLRELVAGGVVAVELWRGRDQIAASGSTSAIAAAGTTLAGRGGRELVLAVSTTDARRFVSRIAALNDKGIAVWRGGSPLGSTLPALTSADFPVSVSPSNFRLGEDEYRGKAVRVESPAGPRVRLGIFTSAESLSEQIAANRLLIATLLVLFVLFALTARSETGKADAGLASATRTAVGVYREELDHAQHALDRVARDPRLQRAVARERIPAAAGRLRELVGRGVVAVELWRGRDQIAASGSTSAIAAAGTTLAGRGGRELVLA
ncbi:MAG TPA: hypothetical protein VH683_09005, partial [Thermoleophilaceae bacterium]